MYQRSHVLTFRRESQLVYHLCRFTQFQVVLSLFVEPQEQCYFGGIAYTLYLSVCRSFFEEGGGVGTDTFFHHVAQFVIG